MSDALLRVRDLKKYFPVKRGLLSRTVGMVKAVDGVSFDIAEGETLGVVGESGCGKTTMGRTVLRLLEPTAGEASFQGQSIFDLDAEALRAARRRMQIVFQDPYSSLNPRMSVRHLLGEALRVHRIAEGTELENRLEAVMARVGLSADQLNRFPHEFSGGQRQRIGIARALVLEPKLIVCDEAVSALDVSIQAQVLNLLMDLQEEFGIAYMFIAHDLSVVRHISTRVAVMYLGRVVESAEVDALFERPHHPYTQALLSAVPVPQVGFKKSQRIRLEGDVPSPLNPPSGCYFHPRCVHASAECERDLPALRTLDDGRQVACHHAERLGKLTVL